MKEIKHKERLNRRVFQANVAGHFVLITVSTVFAVLIRSIPAWNWALIYITAAWFARSEWHGMDGAWRGWVLKTLGLGAGSALVFWMAGAFDPIGHA
ncbi:MAG TPA: hypothetical protein VMT82_03390 [candidate division Zixibacteria bacterium]|nr:hypothetical protein [candidate division Zixibacteria bacterium]